MANAVYERTRAALAGLLPRRAATSVLDRALQLHRRSPDDVSGKQMARVLEGGVYRELEGLVPDPGLRRTLRRLARDARAWEGPPEPEAATPTLAPTAPEPEPPAPEPSHVQSPTPAPVTPIAAQAITAAPIATGALAERRRAPRSDLDLEVVATELAGLDGVVAVGVFDAGGRPLDIRGALADAAELGGLVVAGAALLERGEVLRSVAVDTANGRLVAVPLRPRWLALTGSHDLNLGAVYAALDALEEER